MIIPDPILPYADKCPHSVDGFCQECVHKMTDFIGIINIKDNGVILKSRIDELMNARNDLEEYHCIIRIEKALEALLRFYKTKEEFLKEFEDRNITE